MLNERHRRSDESRTHPAWSRLSSRFRPWRKASLLLVAMFMQVPLRLAYRHSFGTLVVTTTSGVLWLMAKGAATNEIDEAPLEDAIQNSTTAQEESSTSMSTSTSTSSSSQQNAAKNLSMDTLHIDTIEDSMFDPVAADPSCTIDANGAYSDDCFAPPLTTMEMETKIDASCLKGGIDPYSEGDNLEGEVCHAENRQQVVDEHWGADPKILRMRDKLRRAGSGGSIKSGEGQQEQPQQQWQDLENRRPPIFLLPGLASTRLVAWRYKKCFGAFSSGIKVQDHVWLNLNLVIQMGTIDVDCMKECLTLGLNQTDTDNLEVGCKLRPDEGLDAIASLAPGGLGSSLLVGGTNTVYAWLIQWLADNLGYDVSNIIGLPYDWRLTPNVLEKRDGFLTMTRRRIEAAVATNGAPGILVAHSMGNSVFRYFLEWLRVEMRKEAYRKILQRAKKRAEAIRLRQQSAGDDHHVPQQGQHHEPSSATTADAYATYASTYLPGWMNGVISGFDHWYDWLTADPPSGLQGETESTDGFEPQNERHRHAQLWEIAVNEGDRKWLEWLEAHIWTYVGLSAPMLGAVNPLRAVISGENMGLPISDETAREMEVSKCHSSTYGKASSKRSRNSPNNSLSSSIAFGSTHTINPLSTKSGFCDDWDADKWDEEDQPKSEAQQGRLACLDDIMNDIELSKKSTDPWKDFPSLKALLRDRFDWDSGKPMIAIDIENCPSKSKSPCALQERIHISPNDVQSGKIFDKFSQVWREKNDPLIIKREQLQEAFWSTEVPNVLNRTWE